MAKLTDLQQNWLSAYLTHFNATQAAREAGYQASSDTAFRVIGHENRHHPDIADEIRRRLNENAMSADEVLARLADIARSDIGDLLTLQQREMKGADGEDETVEWAMVNLAAAKRAGLTRFIKSITWTNNGPKLELHDAMAALEKIGKAHGLFVDRQEITGKDGERLVVTLDWGDDANNS